MIDEFLELSKDQKLTQEARNEACLAVARLRYERKDFEGALEAYDQVKLPALDPGRATLYLEEAWTRYQLGQIHAAMGLLTTLDAPIFRDEFLPDKYLLRALIYRDLCHYLPAKRAAKELTRQLRRLAGGHPRARGPHPGPAAAARRASPRPDAGGPRSSSSRSSWRASASAATPAASATGSSPTSPALRPGARRGDARLRASGCATRCARRRTSCCAPPSRCG